MGCRRKARCKEGCLDQRRVPDLILTLTPWTVLPDLLASRSINSGNHANDNDGWVYEMRNNADGIR
jgi:hypothetical protein